MQWSARAAAIRAKGIAICAGFMKDLRDVAGVSGVNIQYSGDPQDVVLAVEQAKRTR